MNKTMSAQNMLDMAIAELDCLGKGEMFIIKDLFKGYIWRRQERVERLLLGSLFQNYTKQPKSKAQILSKNASGHQKYQKL